jgi:hypothetical protein
VKTSKMETIKLWRKKLKKTLRGGKTSYVYNIMKMAIWTKATKRFNTVSTGSQHTAAVDRRSVIYPISTLFWRDNWVVRSLWKDYLRAALKHIGPKDLSTITKLLRNSKSFAYLDWTKQYLPGEIKTENLEI